MIPWMLTASSFFFPSLTQRMLMDEIRILQSVCHPNIIRLYDIYETSETVFLVTDYCRGGELFDRLVEKVHYAELDARHIAYQMFAAISYLHDHGIIHRDIKPENILLRSTKEPSNIAISDFGLSRFIPGDGLLLTACGSPQYVAPEVLLGAGYGPEVDIWSAGVVTYCLLAGYTPFYADDQPNLFRQIVAMNYEFEEEYWSGISSVAKDFIRRCLCKSTQRMTPQEALVHPWLANLPPVGSLDSRGCLLQDCKKRHAKARELPKAGVSASDIVEYVRNLCSLRSQHPQLASSAGIEKLRGMADLICRHQHGDALNESEQQKLDDFVAEAKQRVADHDAHSSNAPQGQELGGNTPTPHTGDGAGNKENSTDFDDRIDVDTDGMDADDARHHAPGARVFSAPEEPIKRGDIGSKDTLVTAPDSKTCPQSENTKQKYGDVSPLQQPHQSKRQREDSDMPSPISEKSSRRGPRESNDLTVMMVLMPPPPKIHTHPPTRSKNAQPLTSIMSESESDLARASDERERPSFGQNSDCDHSPASKPVASTSDRRHTRPPSGSRPQSQLSRSGTTRPELSESTTRELNGILEAYSKVELPKQARVDPAVPTRSRNPWTWRTAWAVARAIAVFYGAIGRHLIKGPLKESWGIEMSVFTRMLREGNRLTDLISINTLQKTFELGALLPIARDGLVTPVTFKVRKLGLKGFLAQADAAETGTRVLRAEWVVTKRTWTRLQAEHRQRTKAQRVDGSIPPSPGKGERIIYYIHGGAYFVMSPSTHRTFTIPISRYTDCRIFAIDYRLAPGTVFPGALHDVVIGYFRLVNDLRVPPQNIILGSDSAGGGLSLALMMYLRDNGYPLPGGAILFSPWVDLTMSCRSWEDNAEFDYLPRPASGDHLDPVRAYLGDKMDTYLTHPYASPLFGDLRGLPPLLIQAGDAEVLRDEIILLAHKCQQHGVKRRFELYKDCVHVFPAFLFLDASKQALLSARHFVRTALDGRGVSSQPRARVSQAVVGRLNSEQRTNMVTVNDPLSRITSTVQAHTRIHAPTSKSSTDYKAPHLEEHKVRESEKSEEDLNHLDSDRDQNEDDDGDEDRQDQEQWDLGGSSSFSGHENAHPTNDLDSPAPLASQAPKPKEEQEAKAIDETALDYQPDVPSKSQPNSKFSIPTSASMGLSGSQGRAKAARSMPASPIRSMLTDPMAEASQGSRKDPWGKKGSAPPSLKPEGTELSEGLPRPQIGTWTQGVDTPRAHRARLRMRSGSDAPVRKMHLDMLQAVMDGPEGQMAFWTPDSPRPGKGSTTGEPHR